MLINAIRGGETKWTNGVPHVIGGEPCQMESADLQKIETVSDTEDAKIHATEYWDDAGLVHRSVNIQLKKSLNLFGEQGKING